MNDSQITIDNTTEPIQIEKELIEPLLNLDLQQSNDTKEPLSFASESILSTY
tara:strand:+ start:10398 stop:10553 length:156 start_codon:yes stop_codon:yes gene_type:complete